VKAVSLFSGGLDSILAARLIADQGIDVEALYFKTVFWGKYDDKLNRSLLENVVSQARARLTLIEADKAFFDLVKNPAYGYGKNLNPCIDCRIFILKTAKEYMRKKGASFLITGEVLGQRPMSQYRHVLNKIGNASGVSDIIVRPLSAKLFKASIPEQRGWIDRERLFAMEGRSRKPQLALAGKLGIKNFPNPAGGCLLADKIFSDKMRDMIKYERDFEANDVNLIKNGRLFRLSPKAKLVVGRNEKQNDILLGLVRDKDYSFKTVDIPGPIGVGRGHFDADAIHKAATIIARYSDLEPGIKANVFYKRHPCDIDESISVVPIKEDELIAIRI